MVAQYSETFCSPRTITNGTNGVTENVGLRFLLSQAIPRSQLAMLSSFQTQRQSTKTVGSKISPENFSWTISLILLRPKHYIQKHSRFMFAC